MTKKPLLFIGTFIGILLINLLFIHQKWFLSYQNQIQNHFYDFESASDQIVIVDIDEASLSEEELGPLNRWPRRHYADTINILNQKGASVIGVDVTFPDESSHGKADDFILAGSIKKDSNVVLGALYYFDQKKRTPEWPNRVLMSTEPTIGWINVKQDTDGLVRQIPTFTRSKERVTEAFSLAVARKHLKKETAHHVVKKGQLAFSEDIEIPITTLQDHETNEKVHSMYINYFAAPNTYTHISIKEVLKENFIDKRGKPINFENKIVLIGPTARDLQDYYLSPVGQGVQSAGVEIHANNIQTIIEGKFLKPISPPYFWAILLILLLINTFVFSKWSVKIALPFAILEGIGFIIAGMIVYENGVILNVIHPLILTATSFVALFLLRFSIEKSERRFVEGAFGHYINKDLVNQIIKNPELLSLGGKKKEVTIFFSDIANFTSLSEKMPPESLTQFLNEYLGAMTEIILEHQGTLDKYEGDAIMGFWNAPINQEKHAVLACQSALKQQKKLSELRGAWQQRGLPTFWVRMGIHTGEAVVGNMGSEERFDYTIMGDNVNLASRLEGINKYYGTQVLISGETYQLVKEYFTCREIDYIKVKGKENPVQIYELVSPLNELSQEMSQKINQFHSALSLYRQKNFSGARDAFLAAGNDQPSGVFIKRCEQFIQNPPAATWDGAFSFDVK